VKIRTILLLSLFLMGGCSTTPIINSFCQNTGIITLTNHDIENLSDRAIVSIYKHNSAYVQICNIKLDQD